MRLANKTALITGAGSGIGEGIALAMAAQGATVITTDVQQEAAFFCAERINKQGDKALALCLDVTVEEHWNTALDFVNVHTDGLDILVNNAGVELVKPLADIRLAEWRNIMAINVDGVFLGCQTLLPVLKKKAQANTAGASIINLSSVAGLVGFPNQLAYNTSKGAVRHLSKSLAIEFADHDLNIRVNSIHPGCIRTPMLEHAMQRWVEENTFDTQDPDSVEAVVASLHPLNRIGSIEDIAHGAVYLGSDESGFVTGSELVIDGGWVAR